jgi:hypothetical protein
MGTIIIILIIGLILYALLNNSSQSQKTYTPSEVYPKRENERQPDRSVIDVTRGNDRYISPSDLKKYNPGVPYWSHQYIYSHSEIDGANFKQKEFYQFYKVNFLNGNFFDIEGNTNYAFILLFDLLNDYEYHKNISKLEKLLKDLGQNYPKTKSYGISFLIKIMDDIGDYNGAIRIRNQQSIDNQYSYDYWRIGYKYKAKLNLTDEQVKLLNKLYYPSNNFCNIEFCYIEIIKLYLALISELGNVYLKEETTTDLQFDFVSDVVVRKLLKYRKGSQNYNYAIESTINEFYSNIFKHCENSVRERFLHKRKLNPDPNYTNSEAKFEYETRIISKVKDILPKLIPSINHPDELTEIKLNTLNTNRWKAKFDEIISCNQINPKSFLEDILMLGKVNKSNPSVENIYFEASKYISKINKETALTLYIHYLYSDLHSSTFDNKQLTKTIQKNLFKTNDQLHDFEIIVSELIITKDLSQALKSIPKVYQVKRKKITLDKTSIKEVNQKDASAVKILNEYLKDEFEDDFRTFKSQEINNDEIKIEIYNKTVTLTQSIYLNSLKLTTMQEESIELFLKNSFTVSVPDFDVFAKAKGIFKNQLIESINDCCFEELDDILIEEEDDFYTINEQYYQRLLKNA